MIVENILHVFDFSTTFFQPNVFKRNIIMRMHLITFTVLCCLCSICFAGTGCDIYQSHPDYYNLPVPAPQFNIKPYVNQLAAASRARDALRDSNPSAAIKAYNEKVDSILRQIKEARRKQYRAARCIVSRGFHAWASDKSRIWGPHKYARGKAIVSPPDGKWELDDPLSPIISSKRDRHNGRVRVSNPPIRDGNNVIYDIEVKGPDYGRSDSFVYGVARGQYRLKASYIDQQLTIEMNYLWERVVKAANAR